jgi:hypothetical protein
MTVPDHDASPQGHVAALYLCFSAMSVTRPANMAASTSDWPQWRGPERNGISPEKGLLKQWPKEGPKLLWRENDIGDGYSTPAVVGTRLYLMSNRGYENEFVQALSTENGKPIWTTRVGNVGNANDFFYSKARSTPVDGDFISVKRRSWRRRGRIRSLLTGGFTFATSGPCGPTTLRRAVRNWSTLTSVSSASRSLPITRRALSSSAMAINLFLVSVRFHQAATRRLRPAS